MAYLLDYSAAKLSGSVIRGAGYLGAIRYIDSPQNLGAKHTNLAEYNDLIAHGLTVLLVFEIGTSDSSGGFAAGVANANRAKAGADLLGYHGPIFFCNDQPGLSNPGAWQQYLEGANSVLGRERVGAYGFANAMDAAQGHASYFWQAGRRSDVRPFVHFWQDNNTQVAVGGVQCDRNLILKDLSMLSTEDDLTPDQANRLIWLEQALRTVVNQLTGDPAGDPSFDSQMHWQEGHLPGWASMVDETQKFSMVDYLRLIDLHTCQANDLVKGIQANVNLTDVDKAGIASAILSALPATFAQSVVDEISTRLEGK